MLRDWMRHLFSAARARAGRPHRHPLCLELLEDRTVPYALSGFTWANPNVSVSFMPDGTLISSGYASNLFAVYNAAYPQAAWQQEVARALQSWANVSNLNFHFVSDDGSAQGTPGLAQGDTRFGDIRIGGYNMGSGILGLGWNPNNTTTGGDVELNTNSAFAIGSMPDLASVVMHEVGHGIGFNHSLVDPAVMEGGLWGVYPGPYADDVAGVQAMYGARSQDVYDAAAANDSLATATALSLYYGGVNLQADITSMADLDYYKLIAPAGTNGTLSVTVDASTISLFDPKVSVYDSLGTLLATARASTYQGTATVTVSGLVAGQTYYVLASGATTDAFGMGAYKLSAQFGGFNPPPPPAPDRFEADNTVASAASFGTVTSLSQTALTTHTSTDVDYYRATAASKGTYTVSITPTQGSGNLNLTVLSSNQTVLASGQSSTGGVTLTVNLASGQQFYIKGYSSSGGLFVYNLNIAKASGGGGGGGGGGGHKLVLQSGENTDAGRDVFYVNPAGDPDDAGPAAAHATINGRGSLLSPTQLSHAELAGVVAMRGPVGAFANGPGDLADALIPLVPRTPPVPALVDVTPASNSGSGVGTALWPLFPGLQSDRGVGPIGDEDFEADLIGGVAQNADATTTPDAAAKES